MNTTMIKIRLDELLAEKNVSLYAVSKKTKIGYTTLFRYRENKTLGIQLLHLEKICGFFAITPNDLFKITHQRQVKSETKKR
jgi:DNA-binding Xre family transcriptional regulator